MRTSVKGKNCILRYAGSSESTTYQAFEGEGSTPAKHLGTLRLKSIPGKAGIWKMGQRVPRQVNAEFSIKPESSKTKAMIAEASKGPAATVVDFKGSFDECLTQATNWIDKHLR